jgi:DNA-binding NtrC family response regulator
MVSAKPAERVTSMPDTLLIVEDEELLGSELRRHFKRGGWQVELATNVGDARRLLLDEDLDPLVVLSDMSLPDGNALDLLESVRDACRGGEWIFLTGFGTVSDSVRALRLGAYDFLEKPCDPARLDLVVGGAARSGRAHRRLDDEARIQHSRYSVESFVGSSVQAKEVRALLLKLCGVPFSALVIGGETGTGKGLAARILHHNGARATGPMIEINCASLPRELLESELLGHEAGAFTGARKRHRGLVQQAHGGTLFLDEISEMELDLQTKLLKVIEDRTFRPLGSEKEISVDIQVIAASNRPLDGLAREGEFRSDLYHRLSVFGLDLPPLRSRRNDIEELLPAVIAEFNIKAGKNVRTVPDTVWAALKAYDWPGNVRELRNVVERCVLFSDDEVFPEKWLQLRDPVPGADSLAADGDLLPVPIDGSASLDDIEKAVIRAVLERTDQNATAAARILGTTRQTLRYRIQKHRLASSSDEG